MNSMSELLSRKNSEVAKFFNFDTVKRRRNNANSLIESKLIPFKMTGVNCVL